VTEPVDPTARYLERMRLVSQREYGTEYRPGLAHIFASSDGSPQDLARIGSLIRALDVQNRVRLMGASGAVSSTTGEDNDLLTAARAGAESVKVAHPNQAESADDDLPWWEDVKKWASTYFKGSAIIQQEVGDKVIGEVAKVPGFLYRTVNPSLGTNSSALGGIDSPLVKWDKDANPLGDAQQHAQDMTRQGYGSGIWDSVAFNWNQGESTFRDLSGVRARFPKDDVDLALALWDYGSDRESALFAYRQKLQQDYANGDIDLETAAKKIQRAEDPEFINGAYEALDRQHISVGRDLARVLLPKTWEDDKAFSAISGTADTLWTLFADPTLVGQAGYRAAQVSKWGLNSVNSGKIYHMLGLDDPITGLPAPKKYTGVMGNSRRDGIEDFLGRVDEWRNARAAGDEDGAAAIYESARMAHKDMMPVWGEMSGLRPAITQAERDLAAKEGNRFVDAVGVEYPYGAIKTEPITTIEQFADWATGSWGLMRLANGLPAHEVMMLPGRMGYWAEKRANRALTRTLNGVTDARAKGAELFDFSDANLDKITGTLREDELRRIAEARGQQLFDDATMANGVKEKAAIKFDAMARRVSTLIPESRTLDLASAADAKIVRQWSRIFLPKWESARMASLWESGSPATRRTLLKGLMLQTFEAAGLTRSAAGRDFVDKYINDLDKLDKRRYGFGNSDVISDGYSGARRGGLYAPHIEETVTLPAFAEIRQLAAKAAVMGYDPNLATLGHECGVA
jgi:hypothetical protein